MFIHVTGLDTHIRQSAVLTYPCTRARSNTMLCDGIADRTDA